MNAESQIKNLVSRFDPEQQKLFATCQNALNKRFPGLNQLVYDYGRSIVIAWSPNERGSDAVVSIDASKNGVRLVFTQGVKLTDPKKVLQGKTGQIRYIMVESARQLELPEVVALMAAAEKLSTAPVDHSAKGSLILKESRKSKG